MDSQILQLAFSIYHNPGVYALLLGSGVSRSAGIPTGYEVATAIIEQVAAGNGETISGEPYQWYRERYGQEPSYDALLELMGQTPFERNSLLRHYFEPSDEEREQNIKMPTQAHHALAALIKEGFIKVVLTTNFDRLLEQALEAIGVTPDVISTPDALAGARPLPHSPITIVKLHGDYRDGRIKNTAEELSNYDEVVDRLLDRVLDEYGLIVCGWSAEYDTALKDAFVRAPSRRYTTYWAVYGELIEEAKRLTDHRKAEIIPIAGADQFFSDLQQKVDALKSSTRQHPLSVVVAVERVKKLLPNPLGQIELEQLLENEVEIAYERFTSVEFQRHFETILSGREMTFEQLHKSLQLYFEAAEVALHAIATLCYYGEGKCHHSLAIALRRWAEIPLPDNNFPLPGLPVLLLAYTAGIAATEKQAWRYLQSVFFDPQIQRPHWDNNPNFINVVGGKILFAFVGSTGSPPAQLNQYLHMQLRPILKTCIPSDIRYNTAFDLFEMLLSLAYLTSPDKDRSPEWMPPHLACFLGRSWDMLKTFWFRGGKQNSDWDLLKSEPFAVKPREMEEYLKQYVKIARAFNTGTGQRGRVPDYADFYHQGKSPKPLTVETTRYA